MHYIFLFNICIVNNNTNVADKDIMMVEIIDDSDIAYIERYLLEIFPRKKNGDV